MKKRLDVILFERNLFDSREKAKREIMVGNVIVNEQKITKAGTMYNDDDKLDIRIKDKLKYVSRGGLKLEGAIKSLILVHQQVDLQIVHYKTVLNLYIALMLVQTN